MDHSCRKELEGSLLPFISKTEFPGLPLFKRGQDKDLYDFGERILVVFTDRMAGSHVLIEGTSPVKGQMANQLSTYWFQRLQDVFPNHFVSADVNDFPEGCHAYSEQLAGRSMLVKKSLPLPIRCVVHGYLTGEVWQEYQNTGGLGGIKLPLGMVESQRLPAPIFMPYSKVESQYIDFSTLSELCGQALAGKVRSAALKIFYRAWKMARSRGVLVVESTFEFGQHQGEFLLIDECITPSSSLFWSLETYKTGSPLPLLDEASLLSLLGLRLDGQGMLLPVHRLKMNSGSEMCL